MDSKLSSNHPIFLQIFILWILFSVGIALSATEEEQNYEFKLVPSMNEVVHFENDSYIVSCQVGIKTRLRWIDPQNKWIEKSRGHVEVENRGSESVLIFKSIGYEDSGNWTCEAEEGLRRIAFNMIVYKPISFVDTPVIQSVKENEEAFIKCMVMGDPEPSISWYYNGQPLNLDENKYTKIADGLLIKRVFKNDSGEYSCKAFQISSAMSNVKEQTIRLNIQHKPVAPIRREAADIQYGYLKGFVNITCEAEAEPPATFRWYRNNKHLHSRHNQIINGEHISILQLYLNNTKFFGDYVCEANNTMGILRRTISLKEGKKPPPPSYITLRGMNSNTFDLDVGAKKNGPDDPMDIIGYRFELLQKEKNQSSAGKWMNARVVLKDFTDGVTFLVNNLSPNTTYYVRVASRNPAGLSDWMGPKEFTTHAKVAYGTHAEQTKSTTQAPTQSATQSATQSTSHNVALSAMGCTELLMLCTAFVIFSLKQWNCIY